MNDYIKREDALAFQDNLNPIAVVNTHTAEVYASVRATDLVAYLNAIPAADVVERPRWIPVTERLPEEKHSVIVWEPKYLNSYICVLSEGDWYVFGGYGVRVFGVTHWMPLPEPPQEVDT